MELLFRWNDDHSMIFGVKFVYGSAALFLVSLLGLIYTVDTVIK